MSTFSGAPRVTRVEKVLLVHDRAIELALKEKECVICHYQTGRRRNESATGSRLSKSATIEYEYWKSSAGWDGFTLKGVVGLDLRGACAHATSYYWCFS